MIIAFLSDICIAKKHQYGRKLPYQYPNMYQVLVRHLHVSVYFPFAKRNNFNTIRYISIIQYEVSPPNRNGTRNQGEEGKMIRWTLHGWEVEEEEW